MKARVLSFAIALVTLFAFNNAFAQGGNPHTNKSTPTGANANFITYPENSNNTAVELCSYGTIYGVGKKLTTVQAYLMYTDAVISSTCGNPGNNPDVPGQQDNIGQSEVFNLDVNNGNVDIDGLCLRVPAGCPNAKWTSTITTACFGYVYIVINNVPYLLGQNVCAV